MDIRKNSPITDRVFVKLWEGKKERKGEVGVLLAKKIFILE